MSLSLYSEDGWAANLSSNAALSMLANTSSSRTGILELHKFINEGCTDKISNVIDDLNVLIPTISDKNIKGFATKLRDGLNTIKDKDVAIISQ
jgi:hypothetical protein